jgi:signal transduction histidine kinase
MERAIRRSERLSLLGQLAGGLAHHLRNNVTGALMAVQLHARQCDADPESLEVAQRQLALTEENLKQFLAAPQSTPEASAAPRRRACCLADVVQETIELVGPSLLHRRVGLSAVELNGSADHHIAADQLSADPDQLRHLLINLVLNAAEAAGPGGWVKIETSNQPPCSPESDKSFAILRVRDNGPGPPAEIVQRLFEPFATSKPEGVGLGLAVARQIAESHGGRIVFQRSSGETCFEVHLPNETSSSLAFRPSADPCPAS